MKKIYLFLIVLAGFIANGNCGISAINTNNNPLGLVAYYPFNGNANDESGNGNNPTYIGAGVTLTTDRFGNPDKAYYFDGNADSYIRMPADNFPTTDRTISFWFNADQVENHPTPLSYGGETCNNSLLMIINKGDYPNAYTVLSHCAANFISAPYSEAPINKWYFLTMTISGAIQKIFINGELQQTANTFGTPTVVAGKSAIFGAILFTDGVNVYNEPTAGNFQGKMDDFRFYNRAMTDLEIKNLYNNEAAGLVAYYPFNGNTNDESGNGYDGSVSGATLSSDRYNHLAKAYNFVYNGFSSDRIEVSGTADLNFPTGGFSIAAWVKFSGTATSGNNYPIFSKHICGEQSGYILMLYNGKLTFWLAGSGGYNVLSTPDDYTDNSWHYVVAVYDGTTQYLYIDGALKNSVSFGYNTFNSANWALGGYNGCNGGFNGKIDEIKVFNQAISGLEIQNMYQQGKNDLVAFLPFNGDAVDESGNGRDGTVSGGILTEDRNNNQNSAYTFPNSHDQIVLSNSSDMNLPGGFTLNAWIKYKNVNCGIISKHNCWIVNGFYFGIDNAQIKLRIANSTWSDVQTNEVLEEDKWYMVTGVFDSVNGSESLYIDGHIKASGSAIYNNFNTAPITISEASNGCPDGNMPGAIDEVKIFNRPLSSEEILAEYYASQIDLVAFYPFNGNANDASGNQNNGIVNNAVLSTDRYGEAEKAYLFNGIDSYIEGANPGTNLPVGNSSRSFAAWVKDYEYHQWGSNIFHYGTPEVAPTNFHFLITNVLGLGNGYGYSVTYGNTNLIDSTWHFVCGTYDSTNQMVRLFVDGRLDNSGALSTPPNTVLASKWRIGLFMGGGTPMNGKLDEIRVFRTVLTDQEIQDMYLNETTAPVLQQPLNQSNNASLTPVLQWNSTFQDATFRFQLADDSLFTTTMLDNVTQNQVTTVPEGLLIEGINYYWRVHTTLNDETSPWSDVWKFSTLNTGLNRQLQANKMLSISPNPASSSVKISFIVAGQNVNKEPVTIEIMNSVGTVSLKMEEKKVSPGSYDITLGTENLKPGIYYCRLRTSNQTEVRKLVIAR